MFVCIHVWIYAFVHARTQEAKAAGKPSDASNPKKGGLGAKSSTPSGKTPAVKKSGGAEASSKKPSDAQTPAKSVGAKSGTAIPEGLVCFLPPEP